MFMKIKKKLDLWIVSSSSDYIKAMQGYWMLHWMCVLQRLSFVDVATGSLGQGLSVAAGMAYTAKYFDKAE